MNLCGCPYIKRQMLPVHPSLPTDTKAASWVSFMAAAWEGTTQWDRGSLLVSRREGMSGAKTYKTSVVCYL